LHVCQFFDFYKDASARIFYLIGLADYKHN
jgi:hypothetical protein